MRQLRSEEDVAQPDIVQLDATRVINLKMFVAAPYP